MHPSSHRRRAAGTCALLALGALLAACGDGEGTSGYGGGVSTADASPTTTAATPTASATDDAGTAAPTDTPDEPSPDAASATEPVTPFAGGTALDEGEPSADAMLTVTGIRVGAHEEYDRVVFDLDGTGTPGYRVQYVEEAVEPGSGETVDVAGDAVLQVEITGSAMPTDSGVTEYGGDPVAGPGGSIEQVVYRFVFEGTTTAFVGVDGEPRPFQAFTLEDPVRLVVDVGN
ncbi:AMIN-like domain-containing (lipo)protein [Isoptericola sediminis]|uniref:AMIN-like domain-containing protein n=1 Tax=Isoptericola sediminis TaxID=2733572 RepID=A0A849K4F7_9MICO|nr:hypothetical protein [Isoptericola sediminis]